MSDLEKAFRELCESAEAEKRRHARAVDETIAMVKRVIDTGDTYLEDAICHAADAVGESFRFEMLDFLDAHGLRKH